MFDGITTLSFDLDDTLWPVRPVIMGAERALGEWLDAHYPRIGTTLDRDAIAQLRRSVVDAEPGRAHDLTWVRKRVLALMAERAGYSDALVEPAFEVFDHHRNQVTFYDDALPALEQLTARYRLVSLSNGNASLKKTGLDRFFHAQVSARDAGRAKPHPDMFRFAERAAGVAASEMLHIGDDPHLDVQGARDAGQRAVWVNRDARRWPAELAAAPEVSDLAALVQLLGAGD